MTPVTLCLVGCGAVAALHSRVARTLGSRVRLAYASRSREKAEAYRRRFGGVGAFGGYEEAFAAHSVDAAVICTPPGSHLEVARLAARYRTPVLIEKPVARRPEELEAIEQAIEDAGILAMVAENYFFKPAVRVLREHLDAGDIGCPLFVELNRANRSQIDGWRADPEMMGGGALLEGGVHWINYLCGLGGQVRGVLAVRPDQPYRRVTPFEDNLAVVVKFENGTVGKLLHGWNLVNRLRGVQLSKIYGTDGNIIFESNGLFVLVLGRRWRLRLPGVADLMGYRAMLRHFVECVREGRPPAMSLAVARRDLEVVWAAYRSLESGRFEPLVGARESRRRGLQPAPRPA